jgi:predicted dehydrogenase
MSDYKAAIIGVSGGRARGHAEAYAHIDRGQLVAVSSRNAEKVAEFGDEFGVPARYTDYREMMARERPDLVHVNTPPDVRLEVFEAAAEAGVPALLVEKPLAIAGEDFVAKFVDSIEKRPPLATGEEELKVMKILEGIYRSAASGREVRYS